MKKLPFNDEWLIQNCNRFKSFRELAEEHNRLFGTSFSRMQMKNHAGLILKIRMKEYWYSKEMEEWIRKEYPKRGTSDEKAAAFNKLFGTDKTGQDIKEKARLLGVSLSGDAQEEYKRKSAKMLTNYNKTVRSKPEGYIGRASNGYPCVKTADGTWVTQGRYEYMRSGKEIPSGNVVIFLDGDRCNVQADNLMDVPRKCQALMTINKFWSEEPEITRAGALWGELYLEYKSNL